MNITKHKQIHRHRKQDKGRQLRGINYNVYTK